MNKKARRNAIALHVATVFFTLLLLAGGISVLSIKFKGDATMLKKSADMLDSKLRPKIGTPYTEDMHNRTVRFCANLDASNESVWNGFGKLASGIIVFGSSLSILSLANLFLLIRTVPKEP
jgi:hypothetical protein